MQTVHNQKDCGAKGKTDTIHDLRYQADYQEVQSRKPTGQDFPVRNQKVSGLGHVRSLPLSCHETGSPSKGKSFEMRKLGPIGYLRNDTSFDRLISVF